MRLEVAKEKIVMAIAWRLPRSLAYWCAIRVMAHATTGQWGHEETPALLATDALKRWGEPHHEEAAHPRDPAQAAGGVAA